MVARIDAYRYCRINVLFQIGVLMSKSLLSREEVAFAQSHERTYGFKLFREVWDIDGSAELFWKYGMPHAVQMFALTTEGDVIAVSEFQPGVGAHYLHLPAETFNRGETDPLVVADRGLLEEIGYKAGSRELLSAILENSQKSDRLTYSVLMRDCVKAGEPESGITPVFMRPDRFLEGLLKYFDANPSAAHGGGNSLNATTLAMHRLRFQPVIK